MPARYRKSINLGGGIKLNVNKKSMSLSAGTKGVRYTASTTGRRTTTVGVPGSGLSYQKTTSAKRKAGRQAAPATGSTQTSSTTGTVKPGLFAPKGEKLLFRAISVTRSHGPTANVHALFDQAATHPRFALAASTLAGVTSISDDAAYALPHLWAAYNTGADPAYDHFIIKYVRVLAMKLELAGVEATVPLSRELLALLIGGAHHERRQHEQAIHALTGAPVSPLNRLALADVALDADDLERVLTVTDAVPNTDDVSCMTQALRAAALRRLGNATAALEVSKQALHFPSRVAAARHRARMERGRTYAQLGQKGRARAEYEKVLAENSAYAGVTDALTELDEPAT